MESGAAERFLEPAGRGIDWIVAQQRADRSFCEPEDGVGGYYKVPYALSLAGRQREALRLVDWVAEHNFTAEGRLPRATADLAFGPSERQGISQV